MASTRLRSGIQAFAARGLAAAAVLSLAACKHSRQDPSVVPAVTPTESKEAARQGPPPPSGAQKRIETLRLLVDRDPGDVKSWIALGNEYFDSGQRAKAIDAYGRALELQPNNPDVLTDQGVMYRELGVYDKAIANFKKASTIDPKHVQSMLNLGVLYAQDLKDYDKAAESWQRILAVAPESREAARARDFLDDLKHTAKPK